MPARGHRIAASPESPLSLIRIVGFAV
jgi:hypothetical protein